MRFWKQTANTRGPQTGSLQDCFNHNLTRMMKKINSKSFFKSKKLTPRGTQSISRSTRSLCVTAQPLYSHGFPRYSFRLTLKTLKTNQNLKWDKRCWPVS